jgi:hypothetical protein
MSRWRAAGIHLGISLVIASIVASVVYFLWYPPPYFKVAGGSTLMVLIMGVDVVIGPFLTLAVYRHGKNGLAFDLAVISILQGAAFCYGLSVIAASRPVFIVGAVDRFVPVYANDLDDKDLAQASQPEFARRSWTGPVLVGAVLPTDEKAKSELATFAFAGKDVEKFPKYYVPFDRAKDALLGKSKPLADLSNKAASDKLLIDDFFRSNPLLPTANARYLPLHGRTDEYTMIIASDTGLPLTAIAVDPW